MPKDECYYEAKEKYDVFPSGYASNYIAKCRKKNGKVIKSDKGTKLKRWNSEKWTDEKGNDCGSAKNKNTKKCRPSKRVTKDTPTTWNEISASETKRAVSEKKKVGMGKRTSPVRKSKSAKGLILVAQVIPVKSVSSNKSSKTDKAEAHTALGTAPKKKNGEPKLYKPFKSKKEGKKYSVYVKSESGGIKIIHFGDSTMEHYRDKIGLYSHLDHNDRERRKRYKQRHQGDRINDKNTPGWWSWHKLW